MNEALSGSFRIHDLTAPGTGPRRTTSLVSRASPLVSTAAQLKVLEDLPIHPRSGHTDFETALSASGRAPLHPASLEIFQMNVGKLCNMTCRHCHVDAGPDRIAENMDRETIDLCLRALERTSAHTVDITGGAPELNPNFRYLVDESLARGRHVIERSNLTVLLLPMLKDLPHWLAERGVEIVCSLPHCRRPNTDAQRGDGTFEKSIRALRLLNEEGYGKGDPGRRLTVMTNPAGAFLAGNQTAMEKEWKRALVTNHGVTFDRLLALNNMPIARFLEWLLETDNLHGYMERLADSFNPGAVEGLMCRNTISVSWDGRIFDCDFNQMLDLETVLPHERRPHIRDFDPTVFAARTIVTARHCFGCTAGAGSSCSGATTRP